MFIVYIVLMTITNKANSHNIILPGSGEALAYYDNVVLNIILQRFEKKYFIFHTRGNSFLEHIPIEHCSSVCVMSNYEVYKKNREIIKV